MTWYLYDLVDPENGETRYVGLTNNPGSRLAGHIACCSPNHRKNEWVGSLKDAGAVPVMVVVAEYGVKEDGNAGEGKRIRDLLGAGAALLNIKHAQEPSKMFYMRFPDDIASQVDAEHAHRQKKAGVEISMASIVLDLVKRGLASLNRSRKRKASK